MGSPRDFPPLDVCKPCKRMFVNCEVPNSTSTIQELMTTSDFRSGYDFTRMRKDVEVAAIHGCAFCRAIISGDKQYSRKNAENEDEEPEEDDERGDISGISGEDDNRASDSEEEEDSSDGDYESSMEDEDDQSTTSWYPPWDKDFEFMMVGDGGPSFLPDWMQFFVSDPVRKDYKPRPEWFPPLDEELELMLKYDEYSNCLTIVGKGNLRISDESSWGLYTTKDDPACDFVRARVILSDYEAPETFAMARKWLNECLTDHADCPSDGVVDLPTRLVKVSKLGEPESAQLCYTQGQKGHYCALSYCWGTDQPFSTTKTRYKAYLEALPYNDLPQTIRDAFHVTRSLQMDYIWIDSLCIIQHDPEDVPRELAKMLSIYLNAQFTISAAGAKTCKDGFLARENNRYDRPSPSYKGPYFLPLRVDEDTMGSILIMKGTSSWTEVASKKQPLNERAWTLQEALLTPRLLIFTNLDMVWRCQTKYEPDFFEDRQDYEEHPWHKASQGWGYIFDSMNRLQGPPLDFVSKNASYANVEFEKTPDTPVWSRFRSLVEVYSTRRLTKQSDKLPAISALAETYASQMQCTYLAGLWRRSLVYDLMWWVTDYAEEDQPRSKSDSDSEPGPEPGIEPGPAGKESKAPSWSWASINHAISFNPSSSTRARALVVECSVSLVSNKALFGAVSGGELTIRGYLKDLKVSEKKGPVDDTGNRLNVHVRPDGREGNGNPQRQYWCFTLGYDAPTWRWKIHALILVKSEDHPGCYRRVGYLGDKSDDSLARWTQCDLVTITIV